jgi:hypothetical protein
MFLIPFQMLHTDDHEKIEKVVKLAASVEGVRAVRDELFISK